MIAVIFEVTPAVGQADVYRRLAAKLADELVRVEGFISVERFESLAEPGKILSLSFWRDEAAVMRWRNHRSHRRTQARGRRGAFQAYRLRVAEVVRDYGMDERAEAPADSRAFHSV